MSELQLTENNWEQEVIQSDKPVLIDFWAPWCGPCRMVAPIVSEIAQEYADKLKVGRLNTDEEPGVAVKYGIMSIPTLMIFKNGEVADQIIGAAPKEYFTQKLDEILD